LQRKAIYFHGRVLAADIKHGVPGDCAQCPVARSITRGLKSKAIREKFGEFNAVVVTTVVAIKLDGKLQWYSDKNHNVIRFIQRFDDGYKVKPFPYVLRFERMP